MKTYIIKVHSFVDLITNSSTEIYIKASEKTVSAIKGMIDNILSAGGSKLKCEDLFEVKIDKAGLLEEYKDCYGDENVTEDSVYQKASRGDYNCDISLKVIAKDGSIDAKSAAKVLSSLTGLFNISESYN